MKAMFGLALVFAFAASPLIAPATADHGCNGNVITIGAGPETLYIDDRSGGAATINHWIYLESNQVEGLQSGGEAFYGEVQGVITGVDPCDHENPDTLIF